MDAYSGGSAAAVATLAVPEIAEPEVGRCSVVLLVGSSAASEVWNAARDFEPQRTVVVAVCLEAEAEWALGRSQRQVSSTLTEACLIATFLVVPADSAGQFAAEPEPGPETGLGCWPHCSSSLAVSVVRPDPVASEQSAAAAT